MHTHDSHRMSVHSAKLGNPMHPKRLAQSGLHFVLAMPQIVKEKSYYHLGEK